MSDPVFSNYFYEKYNGNRYSQNGEDGVISELLRRLYANVTGSGWVCEFGAHDGVNCSNTLNLIEAGYNGIYIEGDEEVYKTLLNNVSKYPNLTTINAYVDYNDTENSLDSLLKKTEIPKDLDLMSIGIDGYDYQVWKSIKEYKAKLVIVEINSGVDPNNQEWIHVPGKYQGTGFRPMLEMSINLGYKFLLHTGNMIFARNDIAGAFDINYTDPLENFRTGPAPGCHWGGG